MGEQEPNWSHVASVWWLVTWRTVTGALAVVLILWGVMTAALHLAPSLTYTIVLGRGFITGIVAVVVLTVAILQAVMAHMALNKRYVEFRIALLPPDATLGDPEAQELPVTWRRSIAFWWLIFWRGQLGAIAIGMLFGAILALIKRFSILDQIPAITTPARVLAFILSLIWVFHVFRWALTKKYRGFRIVLIAMPAPTEPVSQPDRA